MIAKPGIYPIALAHDRDHEEEVSNKIMANRERLLDEVPLNVEDRWLQ